MATAMPISTTAKGKKKRLEAKINSDSDLALVRNGMHDVIYTASTSLAAHFGTLTPQVYGKSGTGREKRRGRIRVVLRLCAGR